MTRSVPAILPRAACGGISLLLALHPVSAGAESIDFAHQIVPILEEHCAECHGGEESKGGFSINTRSLFLDDDTAVPGDSAASYFLHLVQDPEADSMMPPEKRSRVPEVQVALLKQWVDQGMTWEPGFTFGIPTYEPPLHPRRPDLPAAAEGRTHPIDRFIDRDLADQDRPTPAPLDDAGFLRRVSLDLTGLLPTPDEARAFLSDPAADKRERLVEELLGREISYAEHWLTFWNDLLRNDYAGTGFITKGRTQISSWLYAALIDNKPFDTMVRELIAPPDASSAGFINGIQWRGTVSAGQTLPIQFSQSLSQSLLGINMKCASCHDSFIDRWTLAEAYGLAAIYAEEPLELHRCDKPTGEKAVAAFLFPELGSIDAAAPKQERLAQLAELLIHPENGRVPRTLVNRLWGQLMGRGIVHPLDAMQTEPWNADLLDWLAADFQDHGYDLKHTLRRIVTSQAYQSRAEVMGESDEDDYLYEGPRPKRLTAEQFRDAIWQVTGTAPGGYDAPFARGVVPPELEQKLAFASSWVWGPSVDEGGVPMHGEKILLRREFRPSKPVRSAGLIAAADNTFVLYLNNREILRGSKWTDLQATTLASQIKAGSNRLLMVAENTGPKPSAAGAFAALRVEYADGTDEILVTDSSWQVSETVPKGTRPGQWKLDDLAWESARPVKNAQWQKATDARIGPALAKASVGSDQMIRASLLKSDALMRSLGRPNRDQIVTSRPNEITTLEAVELSTSAALTEDLRRGGERLLHQHAKAGREELLEEIYLALLTRFPTAQEQSLLLSSLPAKPGAEDLADLLWALMMTPEFFLTR